MAISRILVAQDDNEDNEWLKVDHDSRYIQNDFDDWQYLFGPNSRLSNSSLIAKIACQFDTSTFSNIKIIGYLYDQTNASIGNAATCTFGVYQVSTNSWNETLLTILSGTQLPNNYFLVNPTLSSFPTVNFDGGDTIMIEMTINRLGVIYRDRLYVNHLGIYDNITRLRQDVEFLDITKQDV